MPFRLNSYVPQYNAAYRANMLSDSTKNFRILWTLLTLNSLLIYFTALSPISTFFVCFLLETFFYSVHFWSEKYFWSSYGQKWARTPFFRNSENSFMAEKRSFPRLPTWGTSPQPHRDIISQRKWNSKKNSSTNSIRSGRPNNSPTIECCNISKHRNKK